MSCPLLLPILLAWAGQERFHAPALPELPAPAIELRADTIRLLHGPGEVDDELRPAGRYPLVTALRAAAPGSFPVIGVFGEIPGNGVSIGGGDAGSKDYVVHWGSEPMRFALVGRTPDARIREFSIWQGMNDGRENGGVSEAWFQDLTIEARYTSCVSSPKGQAFGLLRFVRCHFAAGRESLASGAYEGRGYKWGVRSQGRGRWDFRHCTFDPVLEHCLYIDSPQGDSYFLDLEHRGSTRTAIQIVNRAFDNPGPSGSGTLLFEDVRIRELWGDGGSGITVAGHLGPLVFRNIEVHESPGQPGSHGAIAVWTDASSAHGAYLARDAGGALHSTGPVTIESLDIELPHADRPHVSISGAESVSIEGFRIAGNCTAFAFDTPQGGTLVTGEVLLDGERERLEQGSVVNGPVRFLLPPPVALYPGWQARGKVEFQGRALPDAELERW
jgi:hypothetical protein